MAALHDNNGTVETGYSAAWIVERMKENDISFKKIATNLKISEVRCYEICQSCGFSSKILRVDIYFEGTDRCFKAVLKVPEPMKLNKIYNAVGRPSKTEKENTLLVNDFYDREIACLRLFADFIKIPLPKVYATENVGESSRKGAILMEYLPKNNMIEHILIPFTERQILNITDTIAEVVASSLTVGESVIQKYKTSPRLVNFWLDWIQSGIRRVATLNQEGLKKKVGRMEYLSRDSKFLQYVLTGMNQELGIPSVLVHGDIHPQNIFWKRNDDGVCTDTIHALIDWQNAHAGNVCDDLAEVLVIFTGPGTRRHTEEWIFEYFYDKIKDKLSYKGIKMPFTIQQMRTSYDRCLIRHTLYLIAVVALNDNKDETVMRERWNRVYAAVEDSLNVLENETKGFVAQEL